MPIRYRAALKTTRMQAVLSAIGNGGRIVIGTDQLNGGAAGVLATLNLASPAGTVNDDTLTFANTPLTATATANGTAARAEIRDSTGTVLADNLSVGTANAEVIINSTAISEGQTVQVQSAEIIHS